MKSKARQKPGSKIPCMEAEVMERINAVGTDGPARFVGTDSAITQQMACSDTPDNLPGELPKQESAAVSVLTGKRAVIVEDEGVTQLQLQHSLTKLGLVVSSVANTAESGIEAVLRERPDLVLMDIQMPGEMDGLEAAREILKTYRVCIVMLSAHTFDVYKERARDIGVCSYLIKPVIRASLQLELEKAYANFQQIESILGGF